MAAYCDFNEINGGKVKKLYHITYKECQRTVIFIAINMRPCLLANGDIYTSDFTLMVMICHENTHPSLLK